MQGALAAAPLELGPCFVPHLRVLELGVLTWDVPGGCTPQPGNGWWGRGRGDSSVQRRQLGSHQDCHHGNFRD